MTAVGYAVKTMSVTIDPDPAGGPVEYQCAITGVTETPTTESVTTRTACPDGTKVDQGPTSWVVQIDYNVSNLPASLHRLLRDNEGAHATLVIEPFPVEEPGTKISYEVTLSPAGGAFVVGAFGTASVTLPVDGSPTTIDA